MGESPTLAALEVQPAEWVHIKRAAEILDRSEDTVREYCLTGLVRCRKEPSKGATWLEGTAWEVGVDAGGQVMPGRTSPAALRAARRAKRQAGRKATPTPKRSERPQRPTKKRRASRVQKPTGRRARHA